MSNADLWGAALSNATPEEINNIAAEAPKVLADASVSGSGVRDTGLLLTKKQIIDLRKYEAAGLALPYTLKDVEDYLRFGADQDGGVGLFPGDFLTTFQSTRDHARRWSPLRERIMMTGTGLKVFARSMLNYGASMKDVYADVRATGLLAKHNIRTLEQLKELELELGDKFPGVELEPDTVSDLNYYLTSIFKKIDENFNAVKEIKKDLEVFGYDLREHVLPGIKLRVGLIDSSSLAADINTLKTVIDDRAKEIDVRNTEYSAAVQDALKSAAGMNIVGLAMAIYMGVEAENIRAARTKLYEEQERDIRALTSKNQTLGSLVRVKHDLQSLMIVAIDADIATQNLMHVWNVLYVCVENSIKAVDKINDALSLRIFMTEFEEVVLPWKQIESDSDRLIQVFKEADDEYKRNFPARARAMANISFLTPVYPPLKLSVLIANLEQLRDACTQAQVWSVKLGYLPDLFDRFQRLLVYAGEGAYQLQVSALESKSTLENTLRRLARNEADRQLETETWVVKELDEERQQLLDSTYTAINAQTLLLGRCLSNFDDPFDRRLTQAYIIDFEREGQLAKAQSIAQEATLTAYREERKVITDAVRALEKSGIEALGKDIELTIDKVSELGLAPPEVKLVTVAIDQLKKTLINAGHSLRFLDMLRESDKLKQKIEDRTAEIERELSLVQASTNKVAYLRTIHLMEDLRQAYAGEYQAAVEAFKKFLAAISAAQYVNQDALSAAIKEQTPLFIRYLTPVSLPQR